MQRDRVRRAAAELLVVVAGVLIALTADRWVQALDERAAEDAHRDWLARDLVADSAQLEAALRFERFRERAAGHLLLAAWNRDAVDVDADRLLQQFKRVGWSNPPTYATATWSEMVAAGRLALITDVDLRRQISQYYEAQEDLGESEDDWEYRFRRLEDLTLLASPHLPYAGGRPANESDEIDDFEVGLTEADLKRVLNAIRTGDELRSLIGYAGAASRVRQANYGRRLAATARLLAALRGGPTTTP